MIFGAGKAEGGGRTEETVWNVGMVEMERGEKLYAGRELREQGNHRARD